MIFWGILRHSKELKVEQVVMQFFMNIVYTLWDLCLCRFSPFCVDKVKDKKVLLAVFTFSEVDWLWDLMFQWVVQGSLGCFTEMSFAISCIVMEYGFQVLELWDHTADKGSHESAFWHHMKTPQHKCERAAWAERKDSANATVLTFRRKRSSLLCSWRLPPRRVSNTPLWHGEKKYTMREWEQPW